MHCELGQWPYASFVTLTYDDAHLPMTGGLSPIDFELWLKRLRKELDPRKVRYFGVGEYGSRFKRPHYHSIMFGLNPVRDREVVSDTWRLGRVQCGTVTDHSINYVAKYVTEKLYGDEALREYRGRFPPFARMSQGLGRDFCDAHAEQLREALSIKHRGVDVGLPRYFARRLGITEDDTARDRLEHQVEVQAYHLERDPENCHGEWFDWPSVRRSNIQSGIEADARQRVQRKPRKL